MRPDGHLNLILSSLSLLLVVTNREVGQIKVSEISVQTNFLFIIFHSV